VARADSVVSSARADYGVGQCLRFDNVLETLGEPLTEPRSIEVKLEHSMTKVRGV